MSPLLSPGQKVPALGTSARTAASSRPKRGPDAGSWSARGWHALPRGATSVHRFVPPPGPRAAGSRAPEGGDQGDADGLLGPQRPSSRRCRKPYPRPGRPSRCEHDRATGPNRARSAMSSRSVVGGVVAPAKSSLRPSIRRRKSSLYDRALSGLHLDDLAHLVFASMAQRVNRSGGGALGGLVLTRRQI